MTVINFAYTLDIFQLTHFEKWFFTKDANTVTPSERVCVCIDWCAKNAKSNYVDTFKQCLALKCCCEN